MFRRLFIIFVFAIVFGGIFASNTIQAQELTPEERAVLQAQYDELQREIAVQEQIIKDTQAKKNTLQGDVTTLNAQIKAAQAQINAKNITIKQLSSQIAKKNVVIGQLSDRIERGKESLAAILRQTRMMDDYSIVSVALGAQSVSELFSDLDAFTSIKTDLQILFADIRDAKAQTESEKADLAVKQNQTVDAKYVVETQQKQITNNKTQKQQLLTITSNQEVEYKKVLAERQAKASAIRAALFPLRDASAITFENALAYAKGAQAKTGVRPALILAVLTQESNLGKNVGQCYLTNNATGSGVGRNTGTSFAKVMNPSRDVPPFIELGLQLGFDPHRQVVSCPIASAGGWGGAMGPAQFIPSTWAMYSSSVASARGISVANPWDPADAIMAMSIYLGDLGAGAGGYTAEHRAAAKYYAGGAWATAGRVYGNSVLSLAARIQSDIDFLSNN
ncbi:MAG: lytic murein transglycosylase [bacterium]|nr:lytic murein transglycosylase [bacterium]